MGEVREVCSGSHRTVIRPRDGRQIKTNWLWWFQVPHVSIEHLYEVTQFTYIVSFVTELHEFWTEVLQSSCHRSPHRNHQVMSRTVWF